MKAHTYSPSALESEAGTCFLLTFSCPACEISHVAVCCGAMCACGLPVSHLVAILIIVNCDIILLMFNYLTQWLQYTEWNAVISL